uniref:Kelch-like protein 20 n=1 Tax=Monopterus albus TaxID=43700 RepID=A0A3Q3JSM2_MONAL
MDTKPMRRATSARQDATGMDITSRCTLGDPNKLPEGVPQPARMPYISDKHPRQTLEVINLLRKHRELCDVVLVVGAKKIYAHRVILSACSPYFRAMFTGELAESRQTEVVIRDIDERAMELLIDFAYTSQVTVEEGNVQTLLPAACLLQLAEIQEACCEFLKRQLDPSNCLGIRAFADTHSCRELLRIADKFTQHNFQEVMESEEFMLLPANQLIDIISSDELNVRSEEQVFNAVIAWVKYSIQERRPQLPQVLQHVRLPLLSPKFLVGTVGSDPLIKSDEECRDLVDEAKNYLLLPQERPLMQGPRTRPRKPIRCGEVLFAVGGWCSGDAISSVERYDPQTNEWRMVASMSKRRCGVGVSVLDDLLYAVGGHDGSSYLNSVERCGMIIQAFYWKYKFFLLCCSMFILSTSLHSLLLTIRKVQLFEFFSLFFFFLFFFFSCLDMMKTNQWSSDVAPTSTCRTSVGVAVLGGYLYAVGGQDGVSCLNIVERYDPKENKWTRVASMSTRRLGVAVAVLGGFLYAVGGSDGTSPLNTVERYNPQENRWHTVSPMGTRRKHLGCAVYQDMIYSVGGRDDTTELSSAERYNPRTNQWSPVVAMTSRRSGVGLAVVNGQLMAVGGFDGTTYLKTIEVYDPDANTWRLYGGMNYRRLGGGVGVIKMTHCESHIW